MSGPGAGDLFVHGEVLRDGDPVAGAEVSLVIEDLGAAGDPTAYDVPTVTTGEHGGYAFDIDPDELPARYLPGEDYVNFDVVVVEGADRVGLVLGRLARRGRRRVARAGRGRR